MVEEKKETLEGYELAGALRALSLMAASFGGVIEAARDLAECAKIRSFDLLATEMEFAGEKGRRDWYTQVLINADGGYGEAVVRYANAWALAMQKRLAAGEKLEDVAHEESHKADKTYGITGFQYGCAVSTLTQAWKHGDALRRWHNLDTQLRNEGEKANESGGVLNPALLNLGGGS